MKVKKKNIIVNVSICNENEPEIYQRSLIYIRKRTASPADKSTDKTAPSFRFFT